MLPVWSQEASWLQSSIHQNQGGSRQYGFRINFRCFSFRSWTIYEDQNISIPKMLKLSITGHSGGVHRDPRALKSAAAGQLLPKLVAKLLPRNSWSKSGQFFLYKHSAHFKRNVGEDWNNCLIINILWYAFLVYWQNWNSFWVFFRKSIWPKIECFVMKPISRLWDYPHLQPITYRCKANPRGLDHQNLYLPLPEKIFQIQKSLHQYYLYWLPMRMKWIYQSCIAATGYLW